MNDDEKKMFVQLVAAVPGDYLLVVWESLLDPRRVIHPIYVKDHRGAWVEIHEGVKISGEAISSEEIALAFCLDTWAIL